MRLRKAFATAIAAALTLGAVSAQAIDIADRQGPTYITPLDSPEGMHYPEPGGRLIDLAGDFVVAPYVWNNSDKTGTYFRYSTNNGATWSDSFKAAPKFQYETPIVKLSDTSFLMAWVDGTSVYTRKASVVDNALVWDEPVVVADRSSEIIIPEPGTRDTRLFQSGSTSYLFVKSTPTANPFNNGGYLVFTSTNGGTTWTSMASPFEANTGRDTARLHGTVLANGTLVVWTSLKYVDQQWYVAGAYWSNNQWNPLTTPNSSPTDAEKFNWGVNSVTPVNDGKGFAVTYGYPKVYVTVFSEPDATPVDARIGDADVAWGTTVSYEDKIYVAHTDRLNGGGYGSRSVELSVSEDLGATWTSSVFESIPVENVNPDYRYYIGGLEVNSKGELFFYYLHLQDVENGYNMLAMFSSDGGNTWTEKDQFVDGEGTDIWSWYASWLNDSIPTLVAAYVTDMDNYYSPVSMWQWPAPKLPAKLSIKTNFKAYSAMLSAERRAALRTWANEFKDGTAVTVTAPNWNSSNAKYKAGRSAKRAARVAAVLRAAGLEVTVVPGQLDKNVTAVQSRTVTVAYTPSEV